MRIPASNCRQFWGERFRLTRTIHEQWPKGTVARCSFPSQHGIQLTRKGSIVSVHWRDVEIVRRTAMRAPVRLASARQTSS